MNELLNIAQELNSKELLELATLCYNKGGPDTNYLERAQILAVMAQVAATREQTAARSTPIYTVNVEAP